MKLLAIIFGSFCILAPVVSAVEEIASFPNLVFAKTPQRDLLVDVFVPKSVKRPPLVLYIHGGGWHSGNRKSKFAKSLTSDGIAVASMEYRFSREAIFPAQIHDCKGAVRWLRANAEKFGYDADRIVVVGESAGAQLAVLLGTTGGVTEVEGDVGGHLDQSSSVQGVVDFYGATDFLLRARTQPTQTDVPGAGAYELFGGPVAQNEALARMASGVFFVTKDDPPLLAIHGDADVQVLIDQSQRIVQAYKDQGLEAELIVVPGGVHADRRCFVAENRKSVVSFVRKQLVVDPLKAPNPTPVAAHVREDSPQKIK